MSQWFGFSYENDVVKLNLDSFLASTPLCGDLHTGDRNGKEADPEVLGELLLTSMDGAGELREDVDTKEVLVSIGDQDLILSFTPGVYAVSDDRYLIGLAVRRPYRMRERSVFTEICEALIELRMFVFSKTVPDPARRVCGSVFLMNATSKTRLSPQEALKRGQIECVEVRPADHLGDKAFKWLNVMLPFARLTEEKKGQRPLLMKQAPFPFSELREGQSELIMECRGAAKNGTALFVQAPTGIGKTISSLYGAVTRLADGTLSRLFYVTAKASVRQEAEKACRLINRGVKCVRSITMRALSDWCLRAGGYSREMCSQDICPYAESFYEKLPKALESVWNGSWVLTASDIRNIGAEYKICPYYLAKICARISDVVICDYNSVFDPLMVYRDFFTEETECPDEPYMLLIDEAHNLTDRVRDMYSVTVRDTECLGHHLPEREEIGDGVLRALRSEKAVGQIISGIGKTIEEDMVLDGDGIQKGTGVLREIPDELIEAVGRYQMDLLSLTHSDRALFDPDGSRFESANRFVKIFEKERKNKAETSRSSHVLFIFREGSQTALRLVCLDPAPMISDRLKEAKASLFFSATLTPLDYFSDLFGRGLRTATLDLPSPFPYENLCVTVADRISMRASDRDRNMGEALRYIAATVSARKGHYLVFCPSYDFCRKISAAFQKTYPKIKTIVQTPSMTYSQKKDFLDALKNQELQITVGFCVCGGVFAEGVDLPGDSLIGAIIFGTGIPSLSSERNILSEYYDDLNGKGFGYAYLYPGMNAVLQAAGRVIRTKTDRGVVVLVDDRFSDHEHLTLFPNHWKNVKAVGNPESLSARLKTFWLS